MTRVVVEHPIEEAEAMLKRLGSDILSPEDVDLARAGKERLERAVKIEQGTSGYAEGRPTEAEVKALVGQDVSVESEAWGGFCGKLKEVTEPAILVVETEPLRLVKRVPLGAVRSIQPAEDLAQAA